jgi:hypothetical protein
MQDPGGGVDGGVGGGAGGGGTRGPFLPLPTATCHYFRMCNSISFVTIIADLFLGIFGLLPIQIKDQKIDEPKKSSTIIIV